MYDILSSLTKYLQIANQTEPGSSRNLSAQEDNTTTNAQQFIIPSDKCTKFINAALSSNQKETLPNLWNTFLLLTLNGVLSDIHLARKQLLTCCKNGFYGNASQIGSSVLPLLARIWEGFAQDDNSKQEFSHDIISSTITGYGNERSLFEKASIARTLVEIVAFLSNHEVIEMRPVYQFIFSNLSDLTSDFAQLHGNLIKDQDYYDGLIEFGFENSSREVFNSKEFGNFLVNLCVLHDAKSSMQNQKPAGAFRRKRVQFRGEDESSDNIGSGDQAEGENKPSLDFSSLSDQKQQFLQTVIKRLVQESAYKPVTVLSKKFKDKRIWTGISIIDVDLSSEEDKLTRLQVYLELINVYPEVPVLLGKFSDEFENFQDPSDFKQFLKELSLYTHLQPIKRWVRMPHFTGIVESLLLAGSLDESELQTILKFVFRDLFPQEFVSSIIGTMTERIGRDPTFSDDLSHILVSSNFRADLTQIYKYVYLNLYKI